MLVSLIGAVITVMALVIMAIKTEKYLWTSNWRRILPGYQKALDTQEALDKLKVYTDHREEVLCVALKNHDDTVESLQRRIGDLDEELSYREKQLKEARTKRGELQSLNEDLKCSLSDQKRQQADLISYWKSEWAWANDERKWLLALSKKKPRTALAARKRKV